MTNSGSGVKIVFGITVGVLAVLAGISMYMNRDLPVVREAPGSNFQADARLPENHPPLNAANQLAALEQMSKNDPENGEIKVKIGNSYYDLGQYQRAAEAYEESLKLRPRDPGVETDLATCYHELGQYDKALALLENVLSYQPDFAQALYNKGIVLQAGKKDIRGAIAAWEALLQLNPNFPQRADIEQRINQLKSAAR